MVECENMVTLHRLTITIKTISANLEDEKWLMSLCRDLASLSNLKVLKEGFARFEKQGATAFLVLLESHLAIHTWPEYELAYIDILSSREISKKDVKIINRYFAEKQPEITVIRAEIVCQEQLP